MLGRTEHARAYSRVVRRIKMLKINKNKNILQTLFFYFPKGTGCRNRRARGWSAVGQSAGVLGPTTLAAGVAGRVQGR